MELCQQKIYELSRKEVVGRKRKLESLLQVVASAALQSKIGLCNYNKYGVKDNVGLVPVSRPFFDSFMVFVAVPEYLTTTTMQTNTGSEGPPAAKHRKMRRYEFIGPTNSIIHTICKNAGLDCRVKAVDFRPIKDISAENVREAIENAPHRSKQMERNWEPIFFKQVSTYVLMYDKRNTYKYVAFQVYKVSCSSEDLDKILSFLSQNLFEKHGIYISDMDYTRDFSGSFDKEETINHLLAKQGFRMQGKNTYFVRYMYNVSV